MIPLIWSVSSGCYRIPGATPIGGTAATFDFLPPSTMRGAIESLCGKPKGAFTGRFAYGWSKRPLGRGRELKSLALWTSSGEVFRPVNTPFLYRPTYQVAIDSPTFEPIIQDALAGRVDRYGGLFLGESEDIVLRIEPKLEAAEWLVPGDRFILPTRTPKGYGTIAPTLGRFTLSERSDTIPDSAWLG